MKKKLFNLLVIYSILYLILKNKQIIYIILQNIKHKIVIKDMFFKF